MVTKKNAQRTKNQKRNNVQLKQKHKPKYEPLTITRILDAPRERVFAAWVDANQLAQWWGPRMFTAPVCEIDARPKGKILIHMQGPDGNIYPMSGAYLTVDEPKRLVFTSVALDPKEKPLFETLNTVAFTRIGKKTKLTMTATVTKIIDAQAAGYLSGMSAGWNQSIDKLEKYVAAAIKIASREIVTSRIIAASQARVFKAWSSATQLAEWWGPNGFTTTTNSFVFKPKKSWDYIMHGPDGRDYINKITYIEIIAPKRIVYTHGGDEGEVSFHTTVTFEKTGAKGAQTKLTMRALFPTTAERQRVIEKYGALKGANQTIGRLAAFVERR